MNRRLALPIIFFVLVVSAAAAAQDVLAPKRVEPPSPTASAEELVDRADQLRAQKAYLDAIDYFRAALKKENSPVTWNKMGIAQLQLDRFSEAKKSFEKAIKLDKAYADAYNNLGVVFYRNRKYSKSIKLYKKAIQMREASASFHSNLGTAYFSRKDMARAMVEYQRAFEIDPSIFERTSTTGVAAQMSSPEDRAQFSYVLAKLYAQAGNLDRSLQYLRKAMEDGYAGIQNVYSDKEFATLRKDARFSELMASKPVAIPQ